MARQARRAGAGAVALVRWDAREGSEQELTFKGSWPVWGEQAVGSAWVLLRWKLSGHRRDPGLGREGGSDRPGRRQWTRCGKKCRDAKAVSKVEPAELLQVPCGVGEGEREPGRLLSAGASGALGPSPCGGKPRVWGRGVAGAPALFARDRPEVCEVCEVCGAPASRGRAVRLSLRHSIGRNHFFLTED